jgi:hypothetical protein
MVSGYLCVHLFHCFCTPSEKKDKTTLEPNIKASCRVLVRCFMSWNKRSQKCSMRTKKSLFLSILCTNMFYIPVTEHFSFAMIIHPPDRCGISRRLLNSMIITQVHLVLGAIKGHSEMCSFVTQHNATDVLNVEGACNWHTECKNVNQRCCQRI